MRSLSLLSNLLRFLSRAEIPDFLLLPLLPFALPLLPFRLGRDCFLEGEGPSLPELSEQSGTQTAAINITASEVQCHGSHTSTSPTKLQPLTSQLQRYSVMAHTHQHLPQLGSILSHFPSHHILTIYFSLSCVMSRIFNILRGCFIIAIRCSVPVSKIIITR